MKILVVDDEVPIREWVAFSIKKLGIHIDSLELAQNGSEAIESIATNMPDIIFTDVKMPIMDGIELLKYLKNKNYICYTVVLTSHSDFEFARKALMYNADEYILKTEIDDNRIKEIIDRYIENKKKNEGSNTDTNILKKTYIKELLKNNVVDKRLVEAYLYKAQINLSNGLIVAMAVGIEEPNTLDRVKQFEDIDSGGFIEGKNYIIYDDNIVLILANLININSKLLQIQAVQQLALQVFRFFNTNISISTVGMGYEYLCRIIKESINGAERRFYDEKRKIVFCISEIEQLSYIRELVAIKENLISLLERCEKSLFFKVFSDLHDKCKQYEVSEIKAIKDLYIQIISQCALSCLGNLSKKVYRLIKDTEMQIIASESFDELVDFSLRRINEIFASKQSDLSHSKYIRDAIEFTKENFSTIERIQDVTDGLNINTEYFCRLFKKEVGITYINYLTDIKLSKAVELLDTSNMRINEISEVVGYNNFSYFSKAFKKKYKISPYQYRNKCINRD